MAKDNRRRRPKKVLMEAINAKIAGQKSELERLVREHGLDRQEIDFRIELRGGKPYDLGPGKRRTKARKAAPKRAPRRRLSAPAPEVAEATSTLDLLKLERRIAELLGSRPKADVTKAREALKTLEEYRDKVAAAEAVLARLA